MHPEAYKQLLGGELPQLLTVREACRYLSCSRSHFYALRSRKLIDTAKLGNATRVKRSELERYLATLPGSRDGEAGWPGRRKGAAAVERAPRLAWAVPHEAQGAR